MVECQLPKLDVAGSIPVARSNFHEHTSEPHLVSGADGYLAAVCEERMRTPGSNVPSFISMVRRTRKPEHT